MRSTLRVDWRGALSLVGTLIALLSLSLLFPTVVSFIYSDGDWWVYLVALVIGISSGALLRLLDRDPSPGAREAFLVVAFTWLGAAVIGAIPYVLAGNGSVATPINALFESMSGFTTTGATVLADISFDTHSRSILMWRQFTQWLGGMGIIVLAVAVLSQLAVGGAQVMEAETPGPGINKLSPHLAETARALWLAYAAFTALCFCVLYGLHLGGLAPGMDLYNSVAHAFTALPTGGFSTEARSLQAFTPAVQWAIMPFVFVAGVNFALFWMVFKGKYDALTENIEFRFYLGCILVAGTILSLKLYTDTGLVTTGGEIIAGSLEASFRHGFFQVVSLTNSTGYASLDYNVFHGPALTLLLICMFLGGSTGSTGGGIKMLRWLLTLKSLARELFNTVHPSAVRPVRLGSKSVDERAIRGVFVFILLYLLLFAAGILLLTFDTARAGMSVELIDLLTTSIAMLGNIGPGIGETVGPMGGFLDFPIPSKVVMIIYMWLGRLEIFPVLVLFTATYWRS